MLPSLEQLWKKYIVSCVGNLKFSSSYIFKSEKEYQQYLNQDIKIRKEIDENDLDNLKYIVDRSKYHVTKNNKITYYDYGEKFYPELLKELNKGEQDNELYTVLRKSDHRENWPGRAQIMAGVLHKAFAEKNREV